MVDRHQSQETRCDHRKRKTGSVKGVNYQEKNDSLWRRHLLQNDQTVFINEVQGNETLV